MSNGGELYEKFLSTTRITSDRIKCGSRASNVANRTNYKAQTVLFSCDRYDIFSYYFNGFFNYAYSYCIKIIGDEL